MESILRFITRLQNSDYHQTCLPNSRPFEEDEATALLCTRSQTAWTISGKSISESMLENLTAYMKGSNLPKSSRIGMLGVKRTLADDFQYCCLEMNWVQLSTVVLLVYSAFALAFAIGFYALAMPNYQDHFTGEFAFESTFEEVWWLSVGLLVTTGYGPLLPATMVSFGLATIEQFVGMLLSGLLLGIVVTKARLPTNRIVFSDKLLFTTRNGMPIIVFRVGNARGNVLLCPNVRVSYFKPITTMEGEEIYAANKVEFEEPPSLGPAFNMAHRVTESSPIYGMSEEEIRCEGGKWLVVLGGTDEHSLEELHAMKTYGVQDVEFNKIFGNVLLVNQHGERTVDFRKLNVTKLVEGLSTWCGK